MSIYPEISINEHTSSIAFPADGKRKSNGTLSSTGRRRVSSGARRPGLALTILRNPGLTPAHGDAAQFIALRHPAHPGRPRGHGADPAAAEPRSGLAHRLARRRRRRAGGRHHDLSAVRRGQHRQAARQAHARGAGAAAEGDRTPAARRRCPTATAAFSSSAIRSAASGRSAAMRRGCCRIPTPRSMRWSPTSTRPPTMSTCCSTSGWPTTTAAR